MRDIRTWNYGRRFKRFKSKVTRSTKSREEAAGGFSKQEPPRTKLTLKKKTPAASSGASAASKSAEVKAPAQKKNPAEPSKRPAPKGKGTSLKGFSDLRVLRNQINAPQEQKDINGSKKPAASEKKPSRALVKVENEVLRNVPRNSNSRKAFLSANALTKSLKPLKTTKS